MTQHARLLVLLSALGLTLGACSKKAPPLARSTGPALGIPADIDEKTVARARKKKTTAQDGVLKVRLAVPTGDTRSGVEVAIAFDHPMVVVDKDGKLPPVTDP